MSTARDRPKVSGGGCGQDAAAADPLELEDDAELEEFDELEESEELLLEDVLDESELLDDPESAAGTFPDRLSVR
ncbi:hypothetical protein GCM10027169_35260 [Gordonia jinhuaensis]|uniref:Uncharacterized protein n=1 Tax=Gordonia jinhuaensis TaxID=1517702 RepID=A0A916T4B7_9ACTN|nr:hypothetical protein GCM10011489_17870 [Gordonia jinhuaensis]